MQDLLLVERENYSRTEDHSEAQWRGPQTARQVEFGPQRPWAPVFVFFKCGILEFHGFPPRLIAQSPDSAFSVWKTAIAHTYSCEDSFIEYLTVG